nr:MAG TPA: hypothetical protein [Caudoviricetes sp.]
MPSRTRTGTSAPRYLVNTITARPVPTPQALEIELPAVEIKP